MKKPNLYDILEAVILLLVVGFIGLLGSSLKERCEANGGVLLYPGYSCVDSKAIK